MSLIKDLQKFIKMHHILAIAGLLVLGVVVSQYSNKKGLIVDNMTFGANITPQQSNEEQSKYVVNMSGPATGNVSPAQPGGQNEVFASVNGDSGSSQGLLPNNMRQQVVNPDDLLPKDENSQWAQLNPKGNGELNNVNLLQAGYLYGINTVGSSLRNANLQLRSEPPNPQLQVSPWLNTTIEPDLMRTPLELGNGPQ